MTTLTQFQYHEVPELGISVATTKALDDRGNIIRFTGWYNPKKYAQQTGFHFLRSREWSVTRAYSEQNHPDMERDMITGLPEVVDTLIAWPSRDGRYASNLNVNLPEGKIKVPIAIEGSYLDTSKGRNIIDGGEVKELPHLPSTSGILQNDIPELGLIAGVYMWNNPDFNYEEGLRFVVRGRLLGSLVRRFDANANWWPSYPHWVLGFRPARRGLVGTEPQGRSKQVDEAVYKALIEQLNSTEGTPEERLARAREIASNL